MTARPTRMPITRGDCLEGPRPCPWARCRHSLLPERRRPPDGPTCSLDLADSGAMTLDVIGKAIGLTRERVRQIETKAHARLAIRLAALL